MTTRHEIPASLADALGARKVEFDPQTFRWRGVESQSYKFSLGDEPGMGWRGINRFTLAGPPVIPAGFELRYFELAPGGYSSLEKHAHVHCIIAVRGTGKVLVGGEVFDVRPFDLVYVPAATPHRWINEGREPFGFLCPVDAERDPPSPVSEEEWETLRQSPVTGPYTF